MKKSKEETRSILRRSFAIICLLLFIFLSIFILIESGKNAEDSTKSSGMIIAIIQTLLPFTKGSDMSWVRKLIGHYGLFAVTCLFGLLSILLFKFNKKATIIAYISIALWMILLAMASEWIQTMADGRGPSWKDVGIDSLGSLTSFALLGIYYLVIYLRNKSKVKQ